MPCQLRNLGLVVFCFLFFLSVDSLFSQSQTFSIGKINFTSDRTKRTAFDRSFGPVEGETFNTKEERDNFVEELRQRMTKSERFRSFTLEEVPAGNQSIDLNITIVDSWYGVGAVAPFYSTSTGFVAGGGAIFPNVGGYLFDFILAAVFIAEPHGDGLAWDDPTYQGSFGVSKIPLGNRVFFGSAIQVVRNVASSYDRGKEVYRDRSLLVNFGTLLTWEPVLEWTVSFGTSYQAGFMPEVILNEKPYQSYGTLARNLFVQNMTVEYDGAMRENDGIPIGPQASFMIGYGFRDLYYEGVDHSVEFSTSASYSWNVADIFFPSVSAYTYFKTGIPKYDLARTIRGIFDGEWKGNGMTSISANFLFHVYNHPKWIFIHMGPYIDYGASYGPKQNFEVNDQGAAVGLRVRLLFPLAPSTPLFLDFGYDLRDKYKWNELKRFEFTMGSTFSL